LHKQISLMRLDKCDARSDIVAFNQGAVPDRNAGHIGDTVARTDLEPARDFHPVADAFTFFHDKLLHHRVMSASSFLMSAAIVCSLLPGSSAGCSLRTSGWAFSGA